MKKVETFILAGRQVMRFGNRLIMMCDYCHKPIRINKFLIGAFHICKEPKRGDDICLK